MTVGSAVTTAGDVDPEVFTVCCLHDKLVKVSVMLQPVEPLAGCFHIGMLAIVIPSGIVANSTLNVPSGAFSNVPPVTGTNVPLQMWLL